MAPTGENPTEDEDADSGSNWPIKEPREVLADRRLRFPSNVQDAVAAEHPRGLSVYWNHDPDSNFVFISKSPARKGKYDYIARNKIEGPDGDNARIRAPQALPKVPLTKFELKGTYMVYLASHEMLDDENPSAWILTWSQFTSMLPGETAGTDPDDDDVDQMITNNPGFLPSRLS